MLLGEGVTFHFSRGFISMVKKIFRLVCFPAVCFGCFSMISCGVSTGEVVEAGNDVVTGQFVVGDAMEKYGEDIQIEEENYVKNDSLSGEKMKVVYVKPGKIPIIEICPPPFEAFVPGEPVPEKEAVKPGESYDNLLPAVEESDSETGIVYVVTDVPGVEVSFNNRVVGESNIGVVGITPRIYILGLSKEGYKEENLWISVGENKRQVFSITMEKE